MSQGPAYAARYLASGGVGRLRARPLFLTLFVTARCPLRCGHCFYRDEAMAARPEQELTLDEIRQLARRLPSIPKLILTGGEPFLREDLVEITEALADGRSRCRQITVPTSGLYAERVAEHARRVLPGRPGLDLEIQLSIDGVGDQHDAIRGRGVFDKMMATYEALVPLRTSLPGLSIRFNFTFSAVTQDRFGETLRFVTEELGHPQLDMVLIRKTPAEDAFQGEVDLDAYRDAAAQLQRLEVARAGDSRWRRALARRVELEREVIAQHHRGHRELDGCAAGTLTAVIGETGLVMPCEILDRPLGDLRANGFDFDAIWHGEAAHEFRRRVRRTRCFCTFETGVRTTLSFQPRWVLRGLGDLICG